MTTATHEDGERPIPPRFRWLKRLTVAGVAYVVVLVGVRLAWGVYADWRLDRAIAAHRALGEPVLPEDFAAEREGGAADADDLLAAAFNARPRTGTLNPSLDNALDFDHWFEDEFDWFAELLPYYETSLAHTRTVRASAATTNRLPDAGIMLGIGPYSAARAAAKDALVAARIAVRRGDFESAVEYFEDVRFLSVEARRNSAVIGLCVGDALEALALSELVGYFANRILCSSESLSEPDRALVDEFLQSWQAWLSDEADWFEQWRHAVFSERAVGVDLATGLAGGRIRPSSLLFGGRAFRPYDASVQQ